MKAGTPRKMNRWVSASITSVGFSLRRTLIARAFAAELVEKVQHPEHPAIICAMNKIIRPDVASSDAGEAPGPSPAPGNAQLIADMVNAGPAASGA